MTNRTVAEYMTSPAITIASGEELLQAMRALLRENISGAPVVDDNGQLVGILSGKDCLKVAFNASYHQELGGLVRDYMTTDIHTLQASMDIVAASEYFLNSNFRRFPVLKEGKLVGVISRQDVLGALVDMWSNARK